MEFIKLSMQRVWLNLKSLGTYPMVVFLGFLIPSLFCLASTIILPIDYNFGLIIGVITMLIGFIVYGTVAGSFRRSTLNKNTNLTVAVRWVDNFATLVTIILLGFILATYAMGLIMLLNNAGILLLRYGNAGEPHNVYSSQEDINLWKELGFINIYYNVFIISVITYSMSYLFQGFFDSDLMFFSLALIMTILFFLFGSTLNNYFEFSYDDHVQWGTLLIMPDWFYYPSLLFPFYVPAQLLRLQGDSILHNASPKHIWDWLEGTKYAWRYNIMWFVPYVHIFGWWTLGFVYKIFKPSGT